MKWLLIGTVCIGIAAVAAVIIVGVHSIEPTVVDDPYEAGIAWDTVQKAKASSGWSVRLETKSVRTGWWPLITTIAEREGKPLLGASVRVRLDRAHVTLQRNEYVMTQIPKGHYRTEVWISLAGRWDLTITVKKGSLQIPFNITIYAEGPERSDDARVR